MAGLIPFLPFCVTGLENLDHNLRFCRWPVKWKVRKLVKREYVGFEPTLAAEVSGQEVWGTGREE
jgi:hypothetical protein